MSYSFLKGVFRAFGYEVTKNRNLRISLYQAIYHLKKLGFKPNVIVDGGVASGTPAIYKNYPRTKTILVEPLIEYKEYIDRILLRYPAFVHIQKAISDRCGSIEFYLKDSLSGSSEYLANDETTARRVLVESVTLEQIIKQFKITSPALLKLDIEGSEKKVLLANPDSIKQFDVIICEVTFIPKLNNVPSFTEINAILTELDYCLFDVVDLRYYRKSNNLFQADAVFVKKNSWLRLA